MKKKNWTGQKHYMLTFVKDSGKRNNGKVIWEAICECGTTTYVIPNDVVRGNTKSCGCYQHSDEVKEKYAKNGLNSRRYDPIISSARSVWQSTYKDGDIDFDTFYALSQLPCYRCGRLPMRITKRRGGEFTYNGLDRIDNAKGHSRNNVVPCCWDCNQMRGGRTQEEFLLHIKRIVDYSSRLSTLGIAAISSRAIL